MKHGAEERLSRGAPCLAGVRRSRCGILRIRPCLGREASRAIVTVRSIADDDVRVGDRRIGLHLSARSAEQREMIDAVRRAALRGADRKVIFGTTEPM